MPTLDFYCEPSIVCIYHEIYKHWNFDKQKHRTINSFKGLLSTRLQRVAFSLDFKGNPGRWEGGGGTPINDGGVCRTL